MKDKRKAKAKRSVRFTPAEAAHLRGIAAGSAEMSSPEDYEDLDYDVMASWPG